MRPLVLDEESGSSSDVEGYGDSTSSRTNKRAAMCGACCCGCTCCTYVLLLIVLTSIAGPQLTNFKEWGEPVFDDQGHPVTPENFTEYAWWPGCDRGMKTFEDFEQCGPPCLVPEAIKDMGNFTSGHNWSEVTFPARQSSTGESVTLTAWWLPADPANDNGATVVVQHGLSGSFNNMRVQFPAYLLRTAGFSVLTPNLRNHGTSGKSSSEGSVTWGWEYMHDVLGAWDWAVQNKAAGNASKVGIMGNSMGGFVTAIAFGLEPRVPAIWLDGAIFDPRDDLLGHTLRGILGPLAALFTAPVWRLIEMTRGIDLRHHLPEDVLPDGPLTQRDVAVVHSKEDGAVPMSAGQKYVKLFGTELAGKYSLDLEWFPDGTCHGDGHCTSSMLLPQEYRQNLCDFWSTALLEHPCKAPPLVWGTPAAKQ
eukprot:gnl/TRDRNA2_/TRDRNA2_39912_c0_seq1.p1 gnl/TRDRNA2_/TRDRNA2_39912_c0~~gnl/TRDRNA2_/TRDRNA2_39912_c0_seq1.p1  ORF type:complete len:421 (-),score=39.15 gnl/TRDRNA2_/TRDRNA2_39912_c0_seq1:119-1381(-)